MTRLSDLAVNDQGFAFDPTTGTSYTLNASAVLLLRGMRDGLDAPGLAARLGSEFAIDVARAARDVADFTRELRGQGLLSGAEAPR